MEGEIKRWKKNDEKKGHSIIRQEETELRINRNADKTGT